MSDSSSQRFADALMGLFGYGRIVLGSWPQSGIVRAAIEGIKNAGGVMIDTYGVPGCDWECIRFRVHGRRLRLILEEYGEVTLWGPKRLILELSQGIAQRLAASEPLKTAHVPG